LVAQTEIDDEEFAPLLTGTPWSVGYRASQLAWLPPVSIKHDQSLIGLRQPAMTMLVLLA